MFAANENGRTKKVFQKPNILRRKPKAKRAAIKQCESAVTKICIPTPIIKDKLARSPVVSEFPFGAISGPSANKRQEVEAQTGLSNIKIFSIETCGSRTAPVHQFSLVTNKFGKSIGHIGSLLKEHNPQDPSLIKTDVLFGQQADFNEDEQGALNIDSFLVNSPSKQSSTVNSDSTITVEAEANKWCLNFMSEDSKDIVTPNYDAAQPKVCKELDTKMLTKLKSLNNETLTQQAPIIVQYHKEDEHRPDSIESYLTSRVVKYKCNMPNCNKSFWNEARLQKHMAIHSRQKSSNTPTAVECPVKKELVNGVEQKCGLVFPTRDLMMKHLNDDHVPEDAAYKCVRCERRFWWATGLRTHAQTSCTRALVCAWAGCGRVFRQPCRLREHARAHTGDRPYPCNYPNCNWAFRSASKLVRHARMHTGERRHECGACGRAFLRREHLRDHAARCHKPDPRPCSHQDCGEQCTKPTAKKLSRATKKKWAVTELAVMSLNDKPGVEIQIPPASCPDALETAAASASITLVQDTDSFTIQEPEPEIVEVEDGVEEVEEVKRDVLGSEMEGRCARTHCTWPLQRAPNEETYTIEDVQVEQSESSESNIYTVRSDLFLHGNVLINEDSEFTVRESSNRAANESEETTGGQLDTLDLIDSSAIDLMQEELMYGDAAVDESTFRVFLMNGEELA